MQLTTHISEQWRELEECVQEYGRQPVELLAEEGILNERFVGIHAAHLNSHEIQALGNAKAHVCLCRTTERDLGDGLPETTALIDAGVKISVGVDSHASSDAFEEIRAVELDERSRTEKRHVAAEAGALCQMATQNGYEAIGMPELGHQDQVYLKADDPSLAESNSGLLEDAIIFGATPRAFHIVKVGEIPLWRMVDMANI